MKYGNGQWSHFCSATPSSETKRAAKPAACEVSQEDMPQMLIGWFLGILLGWFFWDDFLGVKHYSCHAHICQDIRIISNQLQSLTPDRQFQQHLNIIALALSWFRLKSSPKRHRKMVETYLETNSRCSSDYSRCVIAIFYIVIAPMIWQIDSPKSYQGTDGCSGSGCRGGRLLVEDSWKDGFWEHGMLTMLTYILCCNSCNIYIYIIIKLYIILYYIILYYIILYYTLIYWYCTYSNINIVGKYDGPCCKKCTCRIRCV